MDEQELKGKLAAIRASELVDSMNAQPKQATEPKPAAQPQPAPQPQQAAAQPKPAAQPQQAAQPKPALEPQPEPGVEPEMSEEDKKKKKPKKRKKLKIFAIIFGVLVAMYLTFVFAPIPFVRKWRNIYIETAMSTNSHQWLATWFIPGWIIDEVMETRREAWKVQQTLESNWGDDPNVEEPVATPEVSQAPVIDPVDEFLDEYWELNSKSVRKYLEKNSIDTKEEIDSLVVKDLEGELGLKSKKGDQILAINIPNSLVLLGVNGDDYVGKLAVVKDPSLVCLSKSDYLGSRGQIIDEHAKGNDAILAVNASGFKDVGGHGSGGHVMGSLLIDGVEYGEPDNSRFKFFGMKKNNKMYISDSSKINVKSYRWGVEQYPGIIVDGECIVKGTYGLGIQPRTAIGQAKDGTFMMLVVDGRQIGYSLGCTMEECANQLLKYKAFQAANMDGGSSSIMWFDGEQITRSSSPSGFGRYLPDSLYIKKQ